MKKIPKFKSWLRILIILALYIGFNNTIKCQSATSTTVFELPQECILITDSTIDLTDTISKNIIDGIYYILPKIQSLIPLDSITINLSISSTNVLPFIAVGGRTNKDDSGINIEFYYDPQNPNFKTEFLINGLVHECHHASRLSMPDWSLTLLELMVMEGLADHFMVEVTNCEQPPWSKALTNDDITKYLLKSKPILFIKQESWTQEISEWLIFGRTGTDPIPGWTGYTLGWKIVENYFNNHPGTRASSLILKPSNEIASSTPELYSDN